MKSSVDDLALGRGVVLSRAATLLRSIETQPYDSRICSHTDEHTPLSERRERIKIKLFSWPTVVTLGGWFTTLVLSPSGKTRYPLGVYDGRVQCPAGLVVVIDPTYRPAVRPPARHPRRPCSAPNTRSYHTRHHPKATHQRHRHYSGKNPYPLGVQMSFCHTGNVLVFVCVSLPLHACLKVMVPR